VALTFDDGYDRAACGRIARTLRAHHARGTFFLNGVNLRMEPAAWRRILRGQAVGNHTWSHADLTHLGDAAIRAQILRNESLHERVLGRPMLKVLRPPYGAEDGRVRSSPASSATGGRSFERRHSRLAIIATVGSIVSRATARRARSFMHRGPG
jgi:peptidoglycan/xylan/chitin deacetylase (PgdA/CDA1 family)